MLKRRRRSSLSERYETAPNLLHWSFGRSAVFDEDGALHHQ
jgi:hypothetical protein